MSRFTLELYIARRFLTGILGTFVLCSVLIFMIDFVELLRQSGKFGTAPVRKLAAMAFLRLPGYTEFLIGFAVLSGSIAALVMLARTSELAVMRAGGMSVWQFLRPGLLVAAILGVLAVVVYNPLAAHARVRADRIFAETFGREGNLLATQSGDSWLRQNGSDGPSIIGAVAATRRGLQLTGVVAYVFDNAGRFVERVDATSARLETGYWKLSDAWVVRLGQQPEKFKTYLLATYLTPERVQDALGSALTVSFFDLPRLIELTEKAQLSSDRLRIQYATLLSRPMLCMAMVLLAATVSLRSFRSGGIQTMVLVGMIGGFGFFLFAEVARQIGMAGLAPPWVATWLPVLLVSLVSVTVLLHQEDG